MKIEKVPLLTSKEDFFKLFILSLFILLYSLLIEYNNYKNLTQFESALTQTTLIKFYNKTRISSKGKRTIYQVLKLKSKKGFSFYTTSYKKLELKYGLEINMEIFAGDISFYEYLTSFYANSKILSITNNNSYKEKLNTFIALSHTNSASQEVYQALYCATPLSREVQQKFSTLGISHIFAISGFHLGVLSSILFFLIRYPYKILQNNYFPYRNSKRDIFLIISSILFVYLLFLNYPPSLLRAYSMLVVGFILYDRGIEIISMQTLALTTTILIAVFPRLFFSLGFWLSIAGVFYIFLFLIYFKSLSKVLQFLILPIWVYLFMLPYSLIIFGNFSIYHPLSIVLSTLFTLFYPLSIIIHFVGFANLFDTAIESILLLANKSTHIVINTKLLYVDVILSLLSIYSKYIMAILMFFIFCTLFYAISFVY